ncbi:MAG: hypothetical protein LBF59_02060 [Prevotellaceae bacterium]|nr:hypothetical protein [Prevotellaceae bacterium]
MSKKKKKKVQVTHHQKAVLSKHSATYLKSCYDVARRILQSLGEDASAFDSFTKRQKQDMFRIIVSPPRISVMPGHKVPKQYIRYVQEELIMHMKNVYFDKKLEITWLDIIIVGQSMMLIFATDGFVATLSPSQRKIVDRLHILFETVLFAHIQNTIAEYIRMSLMILSQPNFRIYGQDLGGHHIMRSKVGFQQVVRITTHECQTLRFKYRNKERTAFRVATGQYISIPYTGATIALSKIFPGIKHDRLLNIYIQSHAIHRFKERINTVYPTMRNEFFVLSLMFVQRIVRAPNGMQLIACIMPVENGEKTIGYFAFTIDGENLLVLTLLPLLSSSVPEGRVLYERLHLSSEDLKYLGMDKLSFFYEVDIEQIPTLKQVLYDELHLDYVHTVYNSFRLKNEPFNEKKTLFVKNFFQKLEERTVDYNANNEQNTEVENMNDLDYEF